jgi:hypothetical protein
MNHAAHRRPLRLPRSCRRFGLGDHPIQNKGPDCLSPRAIWYIG